MRLDYYCKQWLKSYAIWVKPSTYQAYLCALGHVPPLELETLTAGHIQHLILKMRSQGLALSTIKHTITIIRQAVLNAEQEGSFTGRINFSLMRYPEEPRHDVLALTVSEQRKLLAVCAESVHGDLFRCLLMTGMRVGEAIALTWNDIDFRERVIHIRSTNYRGVIQTPKTADGIRDIYVSDQLRDLLIGRRKIGTRETDFVFCGRFGKAVDYRSALKSFHLLCEKAGIKDYSIHSLRHTFATNAISAGVSMKTVSDILGHSSISITMDIYASTTMKQQSDCMDSISDYIRFVGI